MNEKYVGSLLAIPADDSTVLAKVIFASDYFKDVIAVKLYNGMLVDSEVSQVIASEAESVIYYTAGSAVRSGRWKIVGHAEVTHVDRSQTERTSGGEVWIEDKHLGKADAHQLERLPKMLVHGPRLIEKYAARSLG